MGQDIASVQFGNDKTLIESRDQIEKSILNLKKIVQDFEKMALGKFFDIMQKAHRVVDRKGNAVDFSMFFNSTFGTCKFTTPKAEKITKMGRVI
jgi:predicted RNA-binding protein with EMAP domain